MTEPFRRPLGLLLSGGGALGAWQGGALARLARTLRFDSVVGFSVGALHAAAYRHRRLGLLESTWRDVEGLRVLRPAPRLSPLSIFGNDSLYELARRAAGEEEDPDGPYAVTCYFPAERRYVHARFGPGQDSLPLLRHYLVASCSIPYVFPPVEGKAAPWPGPLVDGGVLSPTPVEFPDLKDCADVLVLQMVRPDEAPPSPWRPLALRDHYARRWLWSYLENARRSLEGEGRRVFRLWPSRCLPFPMLAFRNRDCARAWELGETDAQAFLADPGGALK